MNTAKEKKLDEKLKATMKQCIKVKNEIDNIKMACYEFAANVGSTIALKPISRPQILYFIDRYILFRRGK